jgi:opacity protein-like surface antigen
MKGPGLKILSRTALLAVMLVTSMAVAQNPQSTPIDLAVTYDALHTNHITAQSFWMKGGTVELGAQIYRGLGIAARVEGGHAGPSSTTAEPLSLVTTVFGPRYTVETRSHRYALFGEGLVRIANGFHSLFSEGSGPVGSVNVGTTSSSNALAVDVGGGLDVQLNRRFAIRASYLRTQFPNTTTNVQNSLDLGAGLVMRFGK